MPAWSIRLVRTGLLYLALGFLVGSRLLLEKAGWTTTGWPGLLPLHVEMVLVGWFVQTTMGVAYWILPRFPTRPERGPGWPVAGAFWLLNLGILLTAAASVWPSPGYGYGPMAGRSLEVLAVLLFGIHAWARVRPVLAPTPR